MRAGWGPGRLPEVTQGRRGCPSVAGRGHQLGRKVMKYHASNAAWELGLAIAMP